MEIKLKACRKAIILITLSTLCSTAFSHEVAKEDPCNKESFGSPFPKLQNCRTYNIVAYGELLDWRFASPNVTYGRDGIANSFTGTPIIHTGKSYYPKFNYDAGYRTGLIVKFGPGKVFDVEGQYASYQTSPQGHASLAHFSGPFIPLNWFAGSTTTNTFQFGRSKLNLHFQWMEVRGGYTFVVNPHLGLRPYLAVAGILVDGGLHTKYRFTNAGGTTQTSNTHAKTSSWSVGPKIGLDVNVHFTPNFGIFYNINFSQQASVVKMKTREVVRTPSTGSVFVAQKGRVVEKGNFPLIPMEMGPTYDTWFCDYKYHVQARATYALGNLAVGTNLSFLNNNNQDPLMLSEFRGVNVRFTVEF